MTKQYDDSNRGSLFKAEKNKETDRDYSGSLNVVCPKCGKPTDFWLSSWINTAKKTGQRFLSVTLKPKDGAAPPRDDRSHAQQRQEPERGRRSSLKDEMDDFIPFAPEFR